MREAANSDPSKTDDIVSNGERASRAENELNRAMRQVWMDGPPATGIEGWQTWENEDGPGDTELYLSDLDRNVAYYRAAIARQKRTRLLTIVAYLGLFVAGAAVGYAWAAFLFASVQR